MYESKIIISKDMKMLLSWWASPLIFVKWASPCYYRGEFLEPRFWFVGKYAGCESSIGNLKSHALTNRYYYFIFFLKVIASLKLVEFKSSWHPTIMDVSCTRHIAHSMSLKCRHPQNNVTLGRCLAIYFGIMSHMYVVRMWKWD